MNGANGRTRNVRRAAIVGGSISGLFAGLLLARNGWDAEVFERSDEPLTGRGAGIVTHPEFAGAMSAVGIGAGETLGVEVTGRRTFDRDGRLIGVHRRRQTLTSWDRLHSLLRARFPARRYHLGKELTSLDADARIIAHFADGDAVECDLLVGADGIRSSVRSMLFPEVVPAFAGYVAWRGLVAEAALSTQTHADIFEHFAFCLPPGEQMLGYPVAGPDDDLRPGHRRYNFVWYRPADQDSLARLLTDVNGRTHAFSIPPPLIDPGVVGEMRVAATRVLAPQFAELVHLADQPILQPIYDLESPHMHVGRAALIGDAAFVARPHVGAGVAKAALDAMALAQALGAGEDMDDGLRDFEQARLSIGRRIVARARELGNHLGQRQSQCSAAPTPEDVMRDIAVLDFLRS